MQYNDCCCYCYSTVQDCYCYCWQGGGPRSKGTNPHAKECQVVGESVPVLAT